MCFRPLPSVTIMPRACSCGSASISGKVCTGPKQTSRLDSHSIQCASGFAAEHFLEKSDHRGLMRSGTLQAETDKIAAPGRVEQIADEFLFLPRQGQDSDRPRCA